MSGLRFSMTPTSQPTQINRTSVSSPPEKKQKMSLTQTYMLAHQARGKLSKEAGRPDHNLRRLVGHANMLDNLMLDLANAEQEQESWFNQTVKNANKASEEPKHIQWADTIPEEVVEVEESSDSDSESEDGDYEIAEEMPMRIDARTSTSTSTEVEDEDEEMEDDDYEDGLALTRTPSAHPPELMHEDSDEESEDEPMPPSPPSRTIPFNALSEKQRQAVATTSFYQPDQSMQSFEEQMQPAIAAY